LSWFHCNHINLEAPAGHIIIVRDFLGVNGSADISGRDLPLMPLKLLFLLYIRPMFFLGRLSGLDIARTARLARHPVPATPGVPGNSLHVD